MNNLNDRPTSSPKNTLFITHWAILIVAIAFIGGGLALVSYREHRNIMSNQSERLRLQARVIAANLDRQLESIHTALLGVRADIPAWSREDNWGAASRRLRAFSSAMTGVRTLLITDAKGLVLACNQIMLLGKDLSWRGYFKLARQTNDPKVAHMSPPFASTLGAFIMSMTVVVPGPSGEFGGIVTASLDPNFFSGLLSATRYAPDMWAAIAHGDGLQFLMNPDRKGQPGKNLAVPGSFFSRHMESGKNDSLLTGVVHATGETRMMALRTIRPASVPLDKPLVLAVGRSIPAMLTGWHEDLWIRGALFLCLALLAVVSLAAYQRYQRRYLQQTEAAQTALAESELWLRSIFNSMDVAIFVTTATPDRTVIKFNQTALTMFGLAREELQEKSVESLHVDAEHFQEFNRRMRLSYELDLVERFEFQLRRKNGEVFPTEHTVRLLKNEQGDSLGILSIVRDITERKQLEHQRHMASTVFESSSEGIVIADSSGQVLMVNAAYSDITGYSAGEVLGRDLDIFRSDSDEPGLLEKVWDDLTQKGRWSGEYWNRRKNGEAYPEWITVSIVRDTFDNIANIIVVLHDITDIKRKEEHIKYQAYHDALTGLPNRILFNDRLGQAIARAEREGERLAVVFMDLDHFKNINDSMGHHAGDLLLQETAKRLKNSLRENDTVSRMGGDEFTMIFSELSNFDDALLVLDRVSKALKEPFFIAGKELSITTSLGVAFFPDDAKEGQALIKCADQAMYWAKENGRDKLQLYSNLTKPQE